VISGVKSQVVTVLESTFDANVGFPLHFSFFPHFFLSAEMLVCICESLCAILRTYPYAHCQHENRENVAFLKINNAGRGVITFVVSYEFLSNVDGSSKECDAEFVCVGKKMCATLLSVYLFQEFSYLV